MIRGDDPRPARHVGTVSVGTGLGETLLDLDHVVVADQAKIALFRPSPDVDVDAVAVELVGTIAPDHDPITLVVLIGARSARALRTGIDAALRALE